MKKYSERHGGPYDRGSADSYYQRPFKPHYFKGATYASDPIYPVEGSYEWEAYAAGFKDNEDAGNFKSWY